MKPGPALLLAIMVGFVGFTQMSEESPQESLVRLNDLEDLAFSMAPMDGAGRFVVVAPIQNLQAVAMEARRTALPGCFGEARDALVASIDQIILAQATDSGDAAMAEAWKRAVFYRSAVHACAKVTTS